MPDGVNTAMNAVKTGAPNAAVDSAGRDPGGSQLPGRNDSVLPR
jgi:hypothetical protein